jgi:hypothetical protein
MSRIAVLAFGSLIKNSTGLTLKSDWQYNAPLLPLEFSRVSSSGDRKDCLTLVIDPDNGKRQPVFFAESGLTNLSDAITELGIREKISQRISIGYINLKNEGINKLAYELYPNTCHRICDWAEENGFEGVIWTGFMANFEKMTEKPFSLKNAIEHLKNLSATTLQKAYDYFDNVPIEIQTPLREYVKEHRMFGE